MPSRSGRGRFGGSAGFRLTMAAGALTALGFGVALARILGAPAMAHVHPALEEQTTERGPETGAVPFAGQPALEPGPAQTYRAIIPPAAPPSIQPQVRPPPLEPNLSVDGSLALPPAAASAEADSSLALSVRPAGLTKPGRKHYTDEDLARISRQRMEETLAPPDPVPVTEAPPAPPEEAPASPPSSNAW